ncbi:MAG: cytochrome c3 family protein [Bacteroidales bacterium]
MKKDKINCIKFIVLFSFIIVYSANIVANNSDGNQENQELKTISSDDLKLGERLFYGLIKTGDNTLNCASCHNTAVIDTFNWNPSVVELAYSTQKLDSAAFANTLLNPVTKRISEAHKNVQLSPEQIVFIRNYIEIYRTEGLTKHKMLVTRLAFFILLILVFIAAFTDLAFTKIIKFKPLHAAIMFIALALIFKIIYEDAVSLGRSKDYAPLQPIKFSHKVHATDNKIDCFYCHHTAETAKSAGIPSTNVCLNCHELVREGTNSGRFEIQKILSNVENGHATEWIRIHKLPDHVFFSHAQHAGVGKLDCAECHGSIKDDHLAKQYEDLSMGWCLDCHRTRKVDFLGNEYYEKTFVEYHKQFKDMGLDSLTIAEMGGENCMKCHY